MPRLRLAVPLLLLLLSLSSPGLARRPTPKLDIVVLYGMHDRATPLVCRIDGQLVSDARCLSGIHNHDPVRVPQDTFIVHADVTPTTACGATKKPVPSVGLDDAHGPAAYFHFAVWPANRDVDFLGDTKPVTAAELAKLGPLAAGHVGPKQSVRADDLGSADVDGDGKAEHFYQVTVTGDVPFFSALVMAWGSAPGVYVTLEARTTSHDPVDYVVAGAVDVDADGRKELLVHRRGGVNPDGFSVSVEKITKANTLTRIGVEWVCNEDPND